jgi:hypothetical protein
VHVDGLAREIPPDELPDRVRVAFDPDPRGGVAFAAEELTADAALRLRVLRVERFEIHLRGGDPVLGTGRDRRVQVDPRQPETNGAGTVPARTPRGIPAADFVNEP